MIKKKLPLLLVTSVIIVLPVLSGIVLWNRLPEQLAIHWNAQGVADGFTGKAGAVFAMPAFLLVVHWVCALFTGMDPKVKNIEGKPLNLVLWICPLISLLVNTLVYTTALGFSVSVEIVMPLVMGALFVVIGNYMPKCSQNYTVGIKLPWTLNDPENWNKTHRFAGILWVVGGVVVMATAFLGSVFLFLGVTLVMVIIPTAYSYCLYRRKAAREA